MSNKIQKRASGSLKEKSQYGLTFGVIAMMLFVAGFPMVVIFFFGIFAYFLWKTFSSSPKSGTRQIFEFYLSANSILRNDERRWYGFEVNEVIIRGEKVLTMMHGAPPLVYFALGALYNKVGDHENAVKHLSYVVEDEHADESKYVHPSAELRKYVSVLRTIEQDPKEAPQMAAAVRSLERARKRRGASMLDESRDLVRESNLERQQIAAEREGARDELAASVNEDILLRTVNSSSVAENRSRPSSPPRKNRVKRKTAPKPPVRNPNLEDGYRERKPITEVLHDIYDKNIQ